MPLSCYQRLQQRRRPLRFGSRLYSIRTAKVSKMEFFGKSPVGFFYPLSLVTTFSSTRPKTLLAIATTVFLHALRAAAERKLDPDVLNNGISYFLGPLLGWTLPGIVLALVRQIRLARWKQPLIRIAMITELESGSSRRNISMSCALLSYHPTSRGLC